MDDLFWDVTEFRAEVFGTFKWGHQVKVGDVQGHELCTGCGYDAVEQDFCCDHISCGSGHFD